MGWTYCSCDGIDIGLVLPTIFSIIINKLDWGEVEEGTQTRKFRGDKFEASKDFG